MKFHEPELNSICYCLSSSKCFSNVCYVQKMDEKALEDFRKRRLLAFVIEKHGDNRASAGRALGYRNGAFINQMLKGVRAISEKTIAQIHELPGCGNWFADPELSRPMEVEALRLIRMLNDEQLKSVVNYLNWQLSPNAQGASLEVVHTQKELSGHPKATGTHGHAQ